MHGHVATTLRNVSLARAVLSPVSTSTDCVYLAYASLRDVFFGGSRRIFPAVTLLLLLPLLLPAAACCTSVSFATAVRTSSSVCCPIATSFSLDILSARSIDRCFCLAWKTRHNTPVREKKC